MSAETTQQSILRLIEPVYTRFTVGMLVSSHYYVCDDTKIDAFSDALAKNDNAFVCAVVDTSMNVHGVIIRKDLFDVLGRRFGRELYYNKSVRDMIQNAKSFYYNMHIFQCAKIIEKDILSGLQDYYVLVDDNGCYRGIFSTKDMLIFLSRLTQMDIEQAKHIISRIIKQEYAVKTKRLHIAIRCDAAKDIGGDSYYVISSKRKNQHIVAVCDASGKGIAASIITTLISGMISSYNFDNNSIEGFLVHLNNFIYATFEGDKFVTACFMILDEDNEAVNMYDFGHSMTYLLRNNTMFKLSSKEVTVPMGVKKMTEVNSGKLKLETGDTIITFTDGFIEQRNTESEEYSMQRCINVCSANNSDDVAKTVNSVFNDINFFKGTYPQQDDMTLSCIRFE